MEMLKKFGFLLLLGIVWLGGLELGRGLPIPAAASYLVRRQRPKSGVRSRLSVSPAWRGVLRAVERPGLIAG